MKTQLSLIILILSGMIVSMNCSLQAQAPPSFKYQAVVRDKSGQVVANQHITLRISILQSGVDGPEIYSELHSVATSELGLINVEVGRGKDPTGSLAAIGWGSGSHFLRIEMDPSGGMDFELVGVSQLLSVPYALYAEQAGSGGREADLDWEVIGNDVVTGHGGSYPTGNVGIGNNAPGSLLYVAKSMGEPTITIRNLGSGGGATYSMVDDLSGADWKFKATMYGGFKIRDHPNALDVLVMEPNSAANLLYVSSSDNVGMGTSTPNPSARLDVSSTNKGFLPPRLTTAERNSIVSPAAGLMIYNLTDLSLEIFNGTSWVSAASSGWSLTGNSGTNPDGNFLGTTDNQPLKFRVNNQAAGEINPLKFNTFFGMTAGMASVGSFNVAFGHQALSTNTDGLKNTAIGYQALMSNINGNSNLASGYQALFSNTSGSCNTALGVTALYSNSVQSHLVAVGDSALYNNGINATEWYQGIINTAVGSKALFTNTIGSVNTAIGAEALFSNSTGVYNTATGSFALYSNGNGSENTAIGANALVSNVSGNQNTATGFGTLGANSSGSQNTANGYWALSYNSIGNNNTATGYQALHNNTSGSWNTAVGQNALYSNVAYNRSTAIGFGAMQYAFNGNQSGQASLNTAIGYEALRGSTTPDNNTGTANTAIGDQALFLNTSGSNNTANGVMALYSNSAGKENVAIGYQALALNTTGEYNTALGFTTLMSNTTGHSNVSVGYQSMMANTSGNYNTALGRWSCYYTNSDYNTGVGHSAGDYHTYTNGTFLGANAYPDDNGYTNCMALGYDAKATASNRVVIGNTSVTSIGGSVGWTNFSDGRFKKNIREDVPGLEFINQLRPVTYTLDVTSLNTDLNKNRPTTLREGEKPRMESQEDIENRLAKEKIVYTGFIAQEVEAAARAVGYDFSGVDAPQNADGHYGLRYAEFVVPLVKAIQEQQVMIEALQEEVRRLKENQAAK